MAFNAVHDLLRKEIDRKEFLRYVGVFLLAITGITGIGKTITTMTQSKAEKGFGAGKYGV